jgi:hypothetical protein
MVRQLKISLFGSFAGTTLKAKAAKFERDRIDYLGAVALLDPNAHVSGPDAIAANIIRAVPAERLHGMGLNDFEDGSWGRRTKKVRPAATRERRDVARGVS